MTHCVTTIIAATIFAELPFCEHLSGFVVALQLGSPVGLIKDRSPS